MHEDNRQTYAIIRGSVSAMDVGKMLGLDIDQHGRCRCPFHHGHDRNMRVYPGNRGYYCFVCHAGGDCISLAKELISEDCNYYEAAKWIDTTFGLHLFDEDTPSVKQRSRQMESRARRKARVTT